jgi:hypothetical protein
VGEVNLEHNGYGVAIALPQIARSTDWNRTYLLLSLRAFLLIALNFFLQFNLCLFIGEASQVLSALGGQMHLCSFGANLDECDGDDPNVPNCVGPGGTRYTPSRLYSYDQWNMQNYVKNALLAALPDKVDEINNAVDPGEYGMENYKCRLLAVWLFAAALLGDLKKTMDLVWLLMEIPSKAEPWIKYVPKSKCTESNAQYTAFPVLGLVDFKIAGMPRGWKAFNLASVVLPKLCLWWIVLWMGIRLLMETAGIMDSILNCMAMSFILDVDEAIQATFGSAASNYILDEIDGVMCQGDEKWSSRDELFGDDEDSLYHVATETTSVKNKKSSWSHWMTHAQLLVPKNILLATFITVVFVAKYYYAKCVKLPDGSWVSTPMGLPKTATYTMGEMFVDSFTVHSPPVEDPFWRMPGT